MVHPIWSYNSIIYEVNIRQITQDGTFAAFERELPRLAELGVTVLWVMPIFPIGETNRKGPLGSYYSIKDYKAVNPEFGSLSDFKHLVDSAHRQGLRIIVDIAANHTAWDSKWLDEGHDSWYDKDEDGNIISPFDWSDTAKLNYNNPEMREAMIDAMLFWVRDIGIDGYRLDMAGLVPFDFWKECTMRLRQIKHDTYMLGEVEDPSFHSGNTFDITYRWKIFHFMEAVAKGVENVNNFRNFLSEDYSLYNKSDMGLLFTSNHDENSWNDTEFVRFGDSYMAFATLTYMLKGTPLIYCGQELGSRKRLSFFDKDNVSHDEPEKYSRFYKDLNMLRRRNRAIFDGETSADIIHIDSSQPYNILAFKRKLKDNIIIAIFNLTPYEVQPAFWDEDYSGVYNKLGYGQQELFHGQYDPFEGWEYKIYYK